MLKSNAHPEAETATMHDLINMYPLGDHEMYCLYLLRTDGWPFTLSGEFTHADDLVSKIMRSTDRRAVIGIWITKESCDGTTEITIYKNVRRVIP